jgi:hypothetical protein
VRGPHAKVADAAPELAPRLAVGSDNLIRGGRVRDDLGVAVAGRDHVGAPRADVVVDGDRDLDSFETPRSRALAEQLVVVRAAAEIGVDLTNPRIDLAKQDAAS